MRRWAGLFRLSGGDGVRHFLPLLGLVSGVTTTRWSGVVLEGVVLMKGLWDVGLADMGFAGGW